MTDQLPVAHQFVTMCKDLKLDGEAMCDILVADNAVLTERFGLFEFRILKFRRDFIK